ncbi:porin family protein [Salegentibacter sp. HM20]
MKKFTLTIGLSILALASLKAQEFNFGVKAGANFATLNGDTDELDSRTAIHVGVISEIPIFERFSFQPELIYSAQGAQHSDSETWEDGTETADYKINLDYINIPLLAKYYITDGLNLQFGPQLGILLNAKEEEEYTFDGETESYEEEIEDAQTIDFSLAAGVGYQLDMGLFFNARYNAGLSNIIETEMDDDYSIKNGVFQLSIGYMF